MSVKFNFEFMHSVISTVCCRHTHKQTSRQTNKYISFGVNLISVGVVSLSVRNYLATCFPKAKENTLGIQRNILFFKQIKKCIVGESTVIAK